MRNVATSSLRQRLDSLNVASPSPSLLSHNHDIHARPAREICACQSKAWALSSLCCMQAAATPDASRWSSLDSRPRFSAVSRGRQTNTDATGTLRPQGMALTRSVRERQHVRGSHMAPCSSLPLHCTAGALAAPRFYGSFPVPFTPELHN